MEGSSPVSSVPARHAFGDRRSLPPGDGPASPGAPEHDRDDEDAAMGILPSDAPL
jgi:hypothetical protein